jgi:hypothetical protein
MLHFHRDVFSTPSACDVKASVSQEYNRLKKKNPGRQFLQDLQGLVLRISIATGLVTRPRLCVPQQCNAAAQPDTARNIWGTMTCADTDNGIQ